MTLKYTFLLLVLALSACSKDPAGGPTDTPDDGRDDAAAQRDVTPTPDLGGTADTANVRPGPDAASDMSTVDAAAPDMTGPVDLGPSPDPVATAGNAELVQDGFQFTEGPRWYPAEGVLRFTDIPATTIYELAEPNTITEFTTMSEGANGLAFDGTGAVLAAQHGGRRVAVYNGGAASSVVDRYEGNRFNSPNDLVLRADGIMYFTDPPYGLTGQREIDFNGLFRFDPSDGSVVAEWEGNRNSTRPNGVTLSPDEKVLYLADTMASMVYAFDVAADGSLSGERDFASVSGPDGMAIDVYGNLYVTTNGGVEVFAPDGSSWGLIAIGRRPANCAFGGADGQTLYVTAREGLYRVPLSVKGIY